MMPTIYWAGPLFTQAERDWNIRIVQGLREAGFTVILPQERGEDLIKPGQPFPVRGLFESALEGIRAADLVVAVLDGPDPDSGTSFECGFAHALGKPVVGLRTDLRLGGDDPADQVNLMLSQSARRFVHVSSGDLQEVVAAVAEAIKGIGSPA